MLPSMPEEIQRLRIEVAALREERDAARCRVEKVEEENDLYKARLEKVVEYVKRQTEKAGYLAGHIITGVVTSIAEGRK